LENKQSETGSAIPQADADMDMRILNLMMDWSYEKCY
ncbi:hypothetical protein A2U01_0109340, partial [Trifolium medium]|nr:hypothetical protein [Trifolium medium]